MEFTEIGIGTWAIGGGNWVFGWGAQDEREAIEGIRAGLDLGINWIDTAPVYGNGASEELVGRAIRGFGEAGRPYLATKCGRLTRADGSIIGCLRRDSVRAECEASLGRLGVERIDLLQIHWPDPLEELEEGWAAMAELVEAGKVGHIGVSNHDVAQMGRLGAIAPVESLQPRYHMLDRGIEEEVLGYCGEAGIGVVCYSPMAKGLLTGGFSVRRAAELPEDDHRRGDPEFRSPLLEANLRVVERIAPIARAHGRPLAQLSIAWVLRRRELTSAIVGVRSRGQIEETAGAAGWELGEEELAVIDAALEERRLAGRRT